MKLQGCYRASNDRSVRGRYPGRQRGGFTLAEILVALGILAIGMSMVAAIFPAAMEFNRASTNDTLGTIICENGLAISELELTAEVVNVSPTPTVLTVFADDTKDDHIKKAAQRYPTGKTDSRTGFVMMVRKLTATGSISQVVTVAYRKTDKDNTVALVPVTCTITGGKDVSGGAGNLRIGSPLINRTTGQFAFLDSINSNGTAGTLDIDPKKRNLSVSGASFYVLLERKPDGSSIPITDMRRSPAIKAMSKVTGLRRDPNPNN
jgi:prepilin-type N-terminal cleavage/methylation domain-containing protein